METNLNGAKFLFLNRKFFLIALILGGIFGFVVTLFIPKKFTSTAIVYPYNSYKQNEIITNPQFGFEVETEQLLQLFESKTMRDRTIKEFNLFDYYELDQKDPKSKDKIILKYVKDVKFSRSQYLSVVISVTTKKPELSAQIANYQVSEVNNYRQSIFAKNRQTEFNNIERQFHENEAKMNALRDSIYAIKSNKKHLLINYIENLNNENYNSEEFIDDPKLENLVEKYVFLFHKNTAMRTRYLEMKQYMDQELPSVYLIDEAAPSYKKDSPSMLVNSLLAGFVFLFLAIVLKLSIAKWNELKSNV